MNSNNNEEKNGENENISQNLSYLNNDDENIYPYCSIGPTLAELNKITSKDSTFTNLDVKLITSKPESKHVIEMKPINLDASINLDQSQIDISRSSMDLNDFDINYIDTNFKDQDCSILQHIEPIDTEMNLNNFNVDLNDVDTQFLNKNYLKKSIYKNQEDSISTFSNISNISNLGQPENDEKKVNKHDLIKNYPRNVKLTTLQNKNYKYKKVADRDWKYVPHLLPKHLQKQQATIYSYWPNVKNCKNFKSNFYCKVKKVFRPSTVHHLPKVHTVSPISNNVVIKQEDCSIPLNNQNNSNYIYSQVNETTEANCELNNAYNSVNMVYPYNSTLEEPVNGNYINSNGVQIIENLNYGKVNPNPNFVNKNYINHHTNDMNINVYDNYENHALYDIDNKPLRIKLEDIHNIEDNYKMQPLYTINNEKRSKKRKDRHSDNIDGSFLDIPIIREVLIVNDEMFNTENGTVKMLKKTKKSKKRYYWQYNVHTTLSKLAIKDKIRSSLLKDLNNENLKNYKNIKDLTLIDFDPRLFDQYTDPVTLLDDDENNYDDDNNSHDELIDVGLNLKKNTKIRKGEGNDITPRPKLLLIIGKELHKLMNQIKCLKVTKDDDEIIQNLKRNEKNKYASRICRLKKKAQLEANKIILYGVRKEHEQLKNIVEELHNVLSQFYQNYNQPNNNVDRRNFNQFFDKIKQKYKYYPVSSSPTEFVNATLRSCFYQSIKYQENYRDKKMQCNTNENLYKSFVGYDPKYLNSSAPIANQIYNVASTSYSNSTDEKPKI